MVSSVNNTTSSTNTTSSLVSGAYSTLDKNAFLKLLIEQLKNQDPLNPQDNTEFVAQLAQFSNLEQSMQTNTAMTTMTSVLQGQSNAQTTSLVGTTATLQGSTLSLSGNGTSASGSFSLAAASTSTKVTITNASGDTVRVLDLGAKKAGINTFTWDGRNSSGDVQPSGSYTATIAATADSGAKVSVSQDLTGVVTSVSFDKGYPVLTLDNGASAPVSDLLRVDNSTK